MSNEEKILETLTQMNGQISQMNGQISQINGQISQINGQISQINGQISQINGRLDQMDGRLDRMEDRLDRVESAQAEMRTVLEKVSVTQEGVVLPRLELLAEGHQTLRETLAPVSRVEKLEEDADVIKSTVRLLTHDVAELKKAQ